MRLGKLDNDELERLVLRKFQKSRKESLAAPEIGVDCAALDLGGEIAVLSCDPSLRLPSAILEGFRFM